MSENNKNEFETSEQYTLTHRNNKHKQITKNCERLLPGCASDFSQLTVRVYALEKDSEKINKRLVSLHNRVAELYRLKHIIIGWAIAAGTIASFIYSNLGTIKNMFP